MRDHGRFTLERMDAGKVLDGGVSFITQVGVAGWMSSSKAWESRTSSQGSVMVVKQSAEALKAARETVAEAGQAAAKGVAEAAGAVREKMGEAGSAAGTKVAKGGRIAGDGLATAGRAAARAGECVVKTSASVTKKAGKATTTAGKAVVGATATVGSGVRKGATRTAVSAANLANAVLATDIAVHMDRWMRATFASGSATQYDQALDHIYNTLKQHGADHRIFDGSHDFVGAWKAVAERFPDAPWLENAQGYVSALWKDMVTPRGLPVVSWDKEAFDSVASFLKETLGINRSWTKDMATFTGTELLGAAMGAIAVILMWNKQDTRRFTEIVASLGFSALVGANPIMVIVTLIGLARCFHQARHGAGLGRLVSGGGRGVAGAAALIGATQLIPAPAWLAIMLGLVSYFLVTKLYDKAEPKADELARLVREWFGSVEWKDSCSGFARDTYLKGKTVVLKGKTVAVNMSNSELAEDVRRSVAAWSQASAAAIGGTWSEGSRRAIRFASERLVRTA